jgi:hypothetical protein
MSFPARREAGGRTARASGNLYPRRTVARRSGFFMGGAAFRRRTAKIYRVESKQDGPGRMAQQVRRTTTMTRMRWLLLTGLLGIGLFLGAASPARAQQVDPALNRFFYYPYYYFPANYWPSQGPQWPEPPGAPYQRPPAYQAYPPFNEPNWRYEYLTPQRYYRGFHFWLDQF